MPEVREYLDAKGHSPFARWFNGLNASAAAKVATSVVRIEQGHKASFRSVGAGVWEYRIVLVRVTGSTWAKPAMSSLSCSAEEPNDANKRISRKPVRSGRTISSERSRRRDNGTDERFQRDNQGAC